MLDKLHKILNNRHLKLFLVAFFLGFCVRVSRKNYFQLIRKEKIAVKLPIMLFPFANVGWTFYIGRTY